MTPLNRAAPVPPEWYWKPEWLEREKEAVFATNWYFAGFTQDLAKPNDYISLTVAGVPVIVRNMKDRLVAFRNICSHRHSLIHPRGCGSAMFRCPYHGWTYDDAGVPIGIPDNAKSFGFDKEAKCTLALDPVQVDTCGRFVFVRLAAQGPSLKHWLGTLVEKLIHLSELFTEIYAYNDENWKCNWKSGLEISVEGYHAPFVHPTTFTVHLNAKEKPDALETAPTELPAAPESESKTDDTNAPCSIEYTQHHAISYGPLSYESSQHMQLVAKRLKLPRSDHMRGYEHYLIYPNLQIGINAGYNFSAIRYEPLTPDLSRVECWLLTGMPADKKLKDGLMWRTVMKSWDDWNKAVLAEDRHACELTQAGLRHAQHQGCVGECEERVRYFQSVLFKDVHNKKAAA